MQCSQLRQNNYGSPKADTTSVSVEFRSAAKLCVNRIFFFRPKANLYMHLWGITGSFSSKSRTGSFSSKLLSTTLGGLLVVLFPIVLALISWEHTSTLSISFDVGSKDPVMAILEHTYTYTHVIYIYIHIYIYMHLFSRTYIWTTHEWYIYIFIYIYLFIYTRIYIYICNLARIFIKKAYIYIYIHIHVSVLYNIRFLDLHRHMYMYIRYLY